MSLISKLSDVLGNGKMVLIQDSAVVPDSSLFYYFLFHKMHLYKFVSVYLFEQSKQDFLSVVDAPNVVVHEFYHLKYSELHFNHVVAAIQELEQSSDQCLFVDSLNPWIKSASPAFVLQNLCRLRHNFGEVVVVLHTDLLSPDVALQFSKIMDINLTLSKMPDTLSHKLLCHVQITSWSKKSISCSESFSISPEYKLLVETSKLQQKPVSATSLHSPDKDFPKIASFNTTINKAEHFQKKMLELPYIKNKRSGYIIYEPDINDDFDYADPDEDLEF